MVQVKHRKKSPPLFRCMEISFGTSPASPLISSVSSGFYISWYLSPLPFIVDGDVGGGMEHPSGTELGFGTGFE